MPSYNRLILLGNLTRDPQLSYTPNQTAVCEFGIASNERWTGQDGNKHEEVLFGVYDSCGSRTKWPIRIMRLYELMLFSLTIFFFPHREALPTKTPIRATFEQSLL